MASSRNIILTAILLIGVIGAVWLVASDRREEKKEVPDKAASAGPPRALQSARMARIGESVPMDDEAGNPAPPGEVTMWRVKFRGNGNIELGFTGVFNYKLAPQESIEDVARRILTSNFPTNQDWKRPENKEPYGSPLSIESDQNRYQLFILENGNFDFSVDHPAFSVATDRRAYYVNSRSVWKDAAGVVQFARVPPESTRPRLAYFTSRALDDQTAEAAAFNLHLDLSFPDGTYVPITIDPDVGHPGGYSDPEGP